MSYSLRQFVKLPEALRKPCGGVKPIAIGSSYRRLASKVALSPLGAQLGKELRPVQLGFGTPGGCEAAAHAARHYVRTLDRNGMVVKIDMRNAFNTVRRDHFLWQIRELAPSLYPFLWQAYAQPTPLYHGTSEIISATGVQQGDPCGPLVFSLAVQPVASAVTSPLNIWFLDDGTLGGEVDDVCADLERLIPAMAKVGLAINPSKCEVILPAASSAESQSCVLQKLHKIVPGASVLSKAEQTLLGAPLTEAATVAAARGKKEEIHRMINRLQHLDSHSAFFLLRCSLWLPRLQYILRAAPVYQQPSLLKNLDDELRSAVENVVNVHFTEEGWGQAVLPVRLGGLGLRKTEDVALPSFTSSLHRCQQLLLSILPAYLASDVVEERQQATADWKIKAGDKTAPDGDAISLQRAWDSPIANHHRDLLLLEANQFSRARLLSAATSESSAWLHALPSATLGTHLDNQTIRIAVALRVGANVCSEHRCKCGVLADSKGYHSLTCRFSAGRHPRHTALNDIVRRALQSAGVPALLEPHGVDRGDGKRPDGMTIYPFSQGRCLVWDATCVNSFAASHLASAATEAGAAARVAEDAKRRKYAELTRRFRFEPVAFETGGACGPSTKSLLREIGAQITLVTGERRETEWLLQRCSIAVVRGNATSVLLTATAAAQTEETAAHPADDCTPAAAPPLPPSPSPPQPPPPPQTSAIELEPWDVAYVAMMAERGRRVAPPPAAPAEKETDEEQQETSERGATGSESWTPAETIASPEPPHTQPSPAAAAPPKPAPPPLQPVNSAELLRLGDALSGFEICHKNADLQPRRLINKSNWCFIHATLQALLSCPPFYHLMRSLPSNVDLRACQIRTPIIEAMVEFVREFSPLAELPRAARRRDRERAQLRDLALDPAFEPSYIYAMLGRMSSDTFCVAGRQEDAEEFLTCLLNGLQDEMTEVLKVYRKTKENAEPVTNEAASGHADRLSEETQGNNGNWQTIMGRYNGQVMRSAEPQTIPINRIFSGQLCFSLHRQGAEPTVSVQPFFSLQLDIQSAVVSSVEQGLESLMARDPVIGLTCPQTGHPVEAWQQAALELTPPTLILHLKRFMYDSETDCVQKLLKRITFPVNLELKRELLSSACSKLGPCLKRYRLFAVVYHAGRESTKGHYATDAYHPGYQQWVRYDDSTVSVVAEAAVLQPELPLVPYILFYRRLDTVANGK